MVHDGCRGFHGAAIESIQPALTIKTELRPGGASPLPAPPAHRVRPSPQEKSAEEIPSGTSQAEISALFRGGAPLGLLPQRRVMCRSTLTHGALEHII